MDSTTISLNREKNLALLLDLQKNIFGDDIDTSKTGFQGYLNDVLSELATQVVTTSVLKQDERFVNTARLDTSLDLLASQFSYSPLTIKPSEIRVIVELSLQPADYSLAELIIPADTEFYFNSNTFLLPGSVKLIRSGTNWFVKQFDNSNYEDEIGDLISTKFTNASGTDIIQFVAKLKQVERQTVTYTVPVRQRLMLQKVDITIPENLYDVSISITNSLGITRTLTKVEGSFNNFAKDLASEIFLIKSGASGYEIWLEGGSRSKFIPSGTTLTIDMLSSAGNIGTINKPSFSVKVPRSLSPRTMTCYSSVMGKVGKSRLALKDKKRAVIAHIQTPFFKTTISSFDIFNKLKNILGLNDTDMALVTRRNDPLMRLIDLFLRMRNLDTENMWANSLNLTLTEAQFVDKIFAGESQYFVNENTSRYVMNYSTKPTTAQLLADDTQKFFFSPFYHKGLANPLRVVSYLLNRSSYYMQLKQKEITNAPLAKSMFPISFNGSFAQDSLEALPTLKYTAIFSSSDKSALEQDLKDNKAEVIFVFKNSTTDKRVGYVKAIKDGTNNFLFSKSLTPNLVPTNGDYFLFREMIYFAEGISFDTKVAELVTAGNTQEVAEQTALNFFSEKLGIDFKIEVLAVSDETLISGNIATELQACTAKTTQLSLYETKEITFAYKNVIGATALLAKKPDITKDEIFIGQVPVIAVREFLTEAATSFSTERRDFIFNALNSLIRVNEYLFKKSEEPSVMAVKFYNTYGFSAQYYNTETTNIKFVLEVTANSSQDESLIRENIKTAVKTAFEESKDSEDHNIYLSYIIDRVVAVTGVRQVRILNLTDNIYQIDSQKIDTLSREQLKVFVPANLSVKSSDITVTFK